MGMNAPVQKTHRNTLTKFMTFLLLASFMLILPMQASAASKSYNNRENVALAKSSHGWTTFDVYYSIREDYVVGSPNVTYNFREQYVTVKSSRAAYDTPYTFTCSNMFHKSPSGTTTQSFTMSNGSYIFPDCWKFVGKVNRTSLIYTPNNRYTSNFSISIYCSDSSFSRTVSMVLGLY